MCRIHIHCISAFTHYVTEFVHVLVLEHTSLTCSVMQLIKIGYGEDMSQSDQQQLFDQLIDFRHCHQITLGLKHSNEPAQSGLCDSMAVDAGTKPMRNSQSHSSVYSETATRVKLVSALSQSPCCKEYKRTGLGTLSVTAKKQSPWRLSDINMQYEFCTR